RDLLRPARKARGTDGLVGLLRILGTADIGPGRARQVPRAEIIVDETPRLGYGLAGHVGAVRTHISNESDRLAADIDALVEMLGNLHGAFGREAQFSRCFLLQR